MSEKKTWTEYVTDFPEYRKHTFRSYKVWHSFRCHIAEMIDIKGFLTHGMGGALTIRVVTFYAKNYWSNPEEYKSWLNNNELFHTRSWT